MNETPHEMTPTETFSRYGEEARYTTEQDMKPMEQNSEQLFSPYELQSNLVRSTLGDPLNQTGPLSPLRILMSEPRETEMRTEDSSSSFGDVSFSVDNANVPLLQRGMVPQVHLVPLLSVLYLYVRIFLASLLIVYTVYLLYVQFMFDGCSIDDTIRDPPNCNMSKRSHSQLRVVISVIIMLFMDPLKCTILGNFFHRKKMIQLQVTLIFWIIFIINNAEDELVFEDSDFPSREEESLVSRNSKDIFYGFSVVRIGSMIINGCYLIFDVVLYPNSLYFSIMIVFFFFLIVGLLTITFLNYIGFTNINIDFLAETEYNNNNGLTEIEMSNLNKDVYKSTRLHTREVRDEDPLNVSESEILCSICFAAFTRVVDVIYLPQCNHCYHPQCIEVWLKRHGTCPLCRLDIKKIVKQDVENEAQEFILNSSMFEIDDI